MKKEKEFRNKVIEISQVYDAYEKFLKKTRISEDEFHKTFKVKKEDITTSYEKSVEFFAKANGAASVSLNIYKDDLKLFFIKVSSTYSSIEIELPNESDIDEVIASLEGIKSTNGQNDIEIINAISKHTDKTETTLERQQNKNKKLWGIGIVISVILFIIGIMISYK